MISFRYHVFTIVAIFLAVALGIAVGNAYVQPALVNTLRNRTDGLRTALEQTRGQVIEKDTAIDQLKSAGDILPIVDRHQLEGREVLVVTQDGVDADVLSETARALDEAQANLVAVLSATDRLLPTDGQPHTDLADLAGLSPGTPPEQVAAAVADRLAVRLVSGPPRRGGQPGSSGDVLDELLRGQYLRFPRGYPAVTESDLANLGGRGEIVIALSGSRESLGIPPDVFMVPLVRSLLAKGATVAAGEAPSTVDPFVEVLRGDGSLEGARLVTVDDLGWPIGGAALVLGLERAVTVGQGGDYGVSGSADGPLPPLP